MAVAGRQTIAVIDLHHAAIAAGPSGRGYFSVRRGAHGVAHGGAEIEARMHGWAAEEWVGSDSEAGGEFDFADHGLSIRHQRQGPVETLHLGAGDVDSVELALEQAGVCGKLDGNVGATHAHARGRGFQLCHVETEIAEYAAHPAHPRFHPVFDRAERRELAALDLIERGLQAYDHVIDALDLRKLIRLRSGDQRGPRLQTRFAIRRCYENDG